MDSTTPRKPQTEECSLKPLCSLSATTRDGLMNGVLSVWPTRIFEEHWQSLGVNYQHSIYQLCDGWVAKYEVWAVKSEISRLVDITLPLNKNEVNMQMRQSFRQHHADIWKSSFPLAISDDLRSIVILRTIHVFKLATASTPARTKTKIIPIDFAEAIQSKWRDDTRAFDVDRTELQELPPTVKYLQTDWYHYTFFFSPGGRYLAFCDCHRFDKDRYLAVFEIVHEDELSLQLINWGLHSGRFDVKYMCTHIAFHPVYDLLAFEDTGVLNLWHFKDEFDKRTQSTSQNHDGFNMDFASCGNYLVLSKQGYQTSVYPVPPDVLRHAQELSRHSENSVTNKLSIPKETRLAALGNADVSAFQFNKGQVVQGSRLVIGKDNQIAGTASITASNSVEICFQNKGTFQGNQLIEVIPLPHPYEVGDIVPTVRIPEEGNSRIRVILDRATRSSCDMKKSQLQGYIVIDRDVDKIKHTFTIRTAPAPVEEPSKKRPKGLFTSPEQNTFMFGNNDEGKTHAFDISDRLMNEELGQIARHSAKRLRGMITGGQSKSILSVPRAGYPRL